MQHIEMGGCTPPQVDVVIVGAGASGLACARRLALSRRRIRILLVEGRERVGGRSLTVPCLGVGTVDLGGQWIGPNQPLALELVQTLGLSASVVRQTWFVDDSKNSSGLIAGASSLTREEQSVFDKLVADVSERSRGVRGPPLDDVWTFEGSLEGAAALDSLSAADFLEQHPICRSYGFFTDTTQVLSQSVRREFGLLIQTSVACDPKQLSFLAFLFFVKACGGLKAVGDGDGGAQTFKLEGGAMQLWDLGSSELKRLFGVDVQKQTDVTAITIASGREADQFPIELRSGEACICTTRALVVAFSPMLWRRVKWHPSIMPSTKAALAARLVGGRAVKVIVVFSTAFWDTSPANGPAHSHERPLLEDCGPIANLFPSTVGPYPALIGLITAQAATEFGALPSEASKRAAVLAQLEAFFGNGAASKPLEVMIMDWQAQKLSGGCFAAFLPPATVGIGTQTAHVTLESPVDLTGPNGCGVGRVAFASTELAASWPSYFEGALDAGYRAADKVGSWLDTHPVSRDARSRL
jgi:monoamine oxidase